MNNQGLHFTGLTLDDDGLAKDPQLGQRFIDVLVASGLDRHELRDDSHGEHWESVGYGVPADSPFSERASAALRDAHA